MSNDGIMITNYHVVDHPDAGLLGVLTYDGKIYPVTEILAADKSADIAVLQLEGSGFPYVSLLPQSPVGSKIWVISNPSKQFYTFTEGIISAQVLQTWSGGSTKRISVTADFGGGSSGAPVFDDHGSVIGMVAATKAVTASKSHKASYAQMVFRYCVPAELILGLFSVDAQKCAE